MNFETDCPAWEKHVAKSFTIGLISYRITYSVNAVFIPVCTYADGKAKRQSHWRGKGLQECTNEHICVYDLYIGGSNI